MGKIKVLQIIKGLDIGGDSGGAELFGIKLAQELHQCGSSEVLICAFYSIGTEVEKNWKRQLNKEGIPTFFVSEWGGYNNITKFIKGVFHLIRKIRMEKIDVTHSHFQLGTLASLIIKILGYTRKSYRTSHIRKEWNHGKWTWLLSPLFIDRFFPQFLDGEIGVSKAVCDYLLSRRNGRVDKNKTHLIYNGINVNQVIEDSKLPLSLEDQVHFPPDCYVIGCVGRLTEQKGHIYLLRAMCDVIELIPKCKLLLIGDGELRDELAKFVEENKMGDFVHFLGLRNNIPALMSKLDLFVLPSLWEGLPTVVIEAMACEVPVIATDIPGTSELVNQNETGILVNPKDPDQILKAILKIYNNKILSKELIRNSKLKLPQYDMKEIASEYYQLFTNNIEN